ncbi:hypothetical protein DPM19_25680 [Actinomadura craniellae]|uniref:Uncharacterized protein n=1 Tax=Actinomadura craniellae TaxID=2231787 RepID=A0A365H0C3_9ACTN|nr:hypothetical protein [Actinomadura craniellae]RAY12520.1 hypothetical protein DPM19_25680 [Actinomadura craniellae]
MRRAVTYVAPWAVATVLAVSLSWLGVRDVLRHAIFDRPGAMPAVGPVILDSPSPPPSARPSPSPSPTKQRPSRKPDPPSNVRSYTVRGGRAALQVMSDRVKLVSATPNPGYETRLGKNEGWLRVDFLRDDNASSIIATWHDGPPIVQIYEYQAD